MSLFNTLFSVGLARRVGLWALIQALPDESELRRYLRAAYLGLAGIIIGSVLTGAALSVALIASYRLLVESGWTPGNALAATSVFTLITILLCFTLATRWFTTLASIHTDKEFATQAKAHSVKDIVSNAIESVTEGFIDGLTSKPAPKAEKPEPRRIRLIN